MSYSFESFTGGGTLVSPMQGNIHLSRLSLRYLAVDPDTTGVYWVTTPDARSFPLGAFSFFIENVHVTNTIEIRTQDGTFLHTLTPGTLITLSLIEGSTQAGVWVIRVSLY